VIGLAGVVVAALVGVVAVNRDSGTTADVPEDAAPEPELPPTPEAQVNAVPVAGRTDGADSQRLPVTATPDANLSEGDMVLVEGAGFTPGATVGVVQCWSDDPEHLSTSVENCDLGGVVVSSADDQGAVAVSVAVVREIAVNGEVRDCADPERPNLCIVAIGNVNDYDESGGAQLYFTPGGDGSSAPVLTLSAFDNLVDGQEIVVTGTGFVPESTVSLNTCVVGGMTAQSTCSRQPGGVEVTVDANGGFSTPLAVRRLAESANGMTDCFTEPYGCRITPWSSNGRQANPVRVYFDGSAAPPDGPEVTLTGPDGGFTDGSIAQVNVSGLVAGAEYTYYWQQCVDTGPTAGMVCHSGPESQVGWVGGTGQDLAEDAPSTTVYEYEPLVVTGPDAVIEVPVVAAMSTYDLNEVRCDTPQRICTLHVTVGAIDFEPMPLRFAGQ
jgi:hypothetical protein